MPPASARDHRYTYYVATRNGGLWKTVNNGTTFEPLFDGVGPQTIGAVAVAPTDPDVVWVGTGESYLARYTYAGNGVILYQQPLADRWPRQHPVLHHHDGGRVTGRAGTDLGRHR